jgi:agmatinase
MTDGIAPVLHAIPTDQDVVICFDIDALDPSLAPNTIGRAPGGLMYHHALGLIKGAAQKTRIAAMDFAEILPEADIDGIGGLTVSRLIAASMGVIARQDRDFAHHR